MSKILIVEDNEMNRDMLSRRLMRKGFDVVMAEDGQKGVDMSISENPDLILMDLSLPVMDGWQATSTIKASEDAKTSFGKAETAIVPYKNSRRCIEDTFQVVKFT